ncbi:hypothetical protein [Flavivirga spongiicola]|uniref:Uncharacterized protein n=1 Tax=Flavivirga spongiicola TaxID=421621 RepID=A0ABU7XNF7_9FLAO|nr:hypothetical protein [Flavivirga sp. MEBiC05379]MDO5981754.1 hypothetical protein [Flavivirga sp. MEBiC05379]
MMIERRFFVWDEEDNNTPVKLGDRVSNLLEQKVIVKSGEKDSEFKLTQNENIWIGSKNDLINYIYFTRNSGDELLRFDPFKFDYPATEPITEFLNEKYEQILFKNIDEVKKNYSGDLLYMVFRDFNPSNIFLMRLENEN